MSTYNNPQIIELLEDADALLWHNLSQDEEGNPIYSATFRLKAHRAYEEPHTLMLPGMPVRHLQPLYPDGPITDKREAVQVVAPLEALPAGQAFQVDMTLHEAQSPLDPVPAAQGAVVEVDDTGKASGGVITQSGFALVGESATGNEAVTVPDGASVIPENEPPAEKKKSGKLSTETQYDLKAVTTETKADG